jgi:hypothetical protein
MKKIIAISLALIFFSGSLFAQSKKEKAIKDSVNIVLDNWHKYAAQSDFDHYFGLLDKKAVFVGTDSTEVWTKKQFKEYAKPYFKKKKGWKFIPTSRHIYIGENPDFVWFDELLDTRMGKCRGSGVLININGQWRIFHYVLSLTVPNDKLDLIKKIIDY